MIRVIADVGTYSLKWVQIRESLDGSLHYLFHRYVYPLEQANFSRPTFLNALRLGLKAMEQSIGSIKPPIECLLSPAFFDLQVSANTLSTQLDSSLHQELNQTFESSGLEISFLGSAVNALGMALCQNLPDFSGRLITLGRTGALVINYQGGRPQNLKRHAALTTDRLNQFAQAGLLSLAAKPSASLIHLLPPALFTYIQDLGELILPSGTTVVTGGGANIAGVPELTGFCRGQKLTTFGMLLDNQVACADWELYSAVLSQACL